MYAVLEVAGEQFRVEKDAIIKTQKLQGEVGSTITFERVMMAADGENVTFGQPTISGAQVVGTIIENFREPKVIVFKKKRRKGYRKSNGHRQHRTAVRIDSISLS